MAQLTSGGIKIPGLGNGTNFQEMIDQLEKIEMSHALQLNKWKQDWKTRLDAFEQVRSAMVEYSSVLKEMNSIDKFMLKNVLNSNTGVCSVTAQGSADNVSHTIEVDQKATNSSASIVLGVNDKLQSINTTGSMQKLTFQLGPNPPVNEVEVDIPPNCTLEGLKNIINQNFGSPKPGDLGMKASVISMGNGKMMLQLHSTSTGAGTSINLVSGDAFWGSSGMNLNPDIGTPLAWKNTDGVDAKVRIDGWPDAGATPPDDWLYLSNNVIDHIPGLTINILGQGTSVIDVSLDTEAVSENINKFVDATNQLRILMKELTDYNDSAMTVDSDYADSQFDTQKGGVLMGNYGMQLMMSKMKSFIFSKPTGFEYLAKDANGVVLSGDLFSSLAHIGIKTDDQQGSPTYGLLVFENNIKVMTGNGVEMITFEKALEMHAQGIGELFAADCAPSVDGYDFGYFSHLPGFTQAGSYEISYEVDGSGVVDHTTVLINGVQVDCTFDSSNQLTVTGDHPAKGLVLDIYNTTPTDPMDPDPDVRRHTSAVRLKSGFLPGLINMLDSDFLDPDSGDKDTRKGTLSVLITQYQNIIQGINDKIAKEDERLTIWRRRMDQRFANLEATLKLYAGLQAQLESQINAMSGSAKKG